MKRKLAGFGLAFAMAELAAAYLPPLASGLTAAVFVAAAFLARRHRLRPVAAGAAAGLCYALLFAVLAGLPAERWAGRTVDCTAVAETDCTASYQEGMLRGTLRLTEVDGEAANLLVYCAAFPGAEPGTRFTACLTLEPLEDNAYRLTRQAKGTVMQAAYAGDYRLLGQSRAPRFWLYRLRQSLSRRVRLWLPRDLGGVEAAMLLGDRSALREAESNDFRAAGVSHLLAVSGLHVSLLCGVLGTRTRRKRRFYRPAIAARALLVLFYMLLTGLPVSVARAGSVFLLALLGDFLLQPADLLTSTGAVAVVMGLLNAYAPGDLGFQLSFCAVMGVQLAAALAKWQREHLRLPNLLLTALDAVQCAAFASLATMPVLVAHGLTVSGAGVLCNLLVVWMLRPALLLGLLVLVLSLPPFLAPAMHLASLLLAVWLKVMVGIIRWCASLPFAALCLPQRYTLWVLAVLGLLALAFYGARRLRWYPLAAALCTAAAVGLGVWMDRDVVRVALVGTAGNPCAVVSQNGEAVVFFRGGSANLTAVEEYLASRGSPALALLVDLRQSPREMEFPARQIITLEELPGDGSAQQTVLTGLTLDMTHTARANLAVLGVAGYHLAFPAGNLKLAEPVQVDTLCAAGVYSGSLQADTILYTAKAPGWLDKTAGEKLLYGGETPVIVLRPGRSVVFEEVTQVALQ